MPNAWRGIHRTTNSGRAGALQAGKLETRRVLNRGNPAKTRFSRVDDPNAKNSNSTKLLLNDSRHQSPALHGVQPLRLDVLKYWGIIGCGTIIYSRILPM